MITHVKHNIKPNHMSTHFTGVRLRKPETQIFDVGDLFMSLLDTLENTNTSQNGATIGSRTTNSPNLDADAIPDPSIANLFGNPYELGNSIAVINSAPGVRTLDGVVQTHKGVDYAATQGTNLLAIADGVVEQVRWQMGESRGFGLYIVINHGKLGDDNNYYKSLYGHVSELDKKIIGKTINELTPEDIQKMVSYDGFKPNTKVVKGQVIGKSGGNAGVNYLQQSPKKYDLAGGSKKAHLHYELRIDTVDKEIFSMKYVNSVPYFPLGATAIYKNGNIPKVNEGTVLGSNADFWSLAAVCSLEAGNPQARADVAQSIFNRLSVPSKPYGKSIKEIIVALNQYEPTFNNKSDWKKINDEETAITAIMKAKNWTYTVARSALKQSNTAIQNETLLKNSRDFIGTRTEFLAEKPTSAEAQGVVERTPVNINNAFFWRYAGIKIKNSPVPLAPNWAALNVETSMV
jgi:murein DD-endopeptidase MepM/ murein hydrolase activator NlpD